MKKNKNDYLSLLFSNSGFIVVNKAILRTLSLNVAVFIGELCSEYNYYKEKEQLTNSEWFYSTTPNIEDNTGLNRYFQDECIKKLTDLKIIETKLMGMPSKRYFKINFYELEKVLKNTQKNAKKNEKSPKNQGCKPVASKVVNHSQTRLQKSRKQGCEPVASKDVNQTQARLRTSSKQGCKPVATNNNNNNNKLKRINNNLILSDKDKMREDMASIALFAKNINLPYLTNIYKNKETSKKIFNNLLDIFTEILKSKKEYYKISGDQIEVNSLKNKLNKFNEDHIIYIMDNLLNNTTKIKNIKAYILATINNAPMTIDAYYLNQVKSDMSKVA